MSTFLIFEFLFSEAPKHGVEGFWGDRGAGILLFAADTQRFLVLQRSRRIQQGGTWGIPGGALDYKEEGTLEGAKRELSEEVGMEPELTKVFPGYVFSSPKGSFKYYNYIAVTPTEFVPDLSDGESTDYKWLSFPELLELGNKHFGLSVLIENSREIIETLTKQKKKRK
jgi:8-oxo-dGTP pyrophosphatase MutT (NUDIX family)